MNTDKELTPEGIKNFLLSITKMFYTQGDSYFAHESKKGKWVFGYSNDYPMQHGNGEVITLPKEVVIAFMKYGQQQYEAGRQESKWILLKDQHPDKFITLEVSDCNFIASCFFNGTGFQLNDGSADEIATANIIYWRYATLPSAPDQGKESKE